MLTFDEKYDIRLATRDDMDRIMFFIGSHWKADHILALDRRLFEYEFCLDETVNFVLAIDKAKHSIEAIFGFIYTSNPQNNQQPDIFGSFWKVAEDDDNLPFLGVELAKRVHDLTGCRMHIGNGANPDTTIPLRRMFFGDQTAKMKQYYLINPNLNDFKIAQITEKPEINQKNNKNSVNLKVERLYNFDNIKKTLDLSLFQALPYKDYWYLERRYLKHPYYNYWIYHVLDDDLKSQAILVIRKIYSQSSSCLRIIDYIGETSVFSKLTSFFDDLLNETDSEYIDFYELGFSDEILIDAGFTLNNDSVNIIPNYFEPFVKKNIDIWAHYKYDNTLIFKGDGDQDRPNVYDERVWKKCKV